MIDLSKPWHAYPVAVLDTETSGLPEDGGRVVEIGVVRFEGGFPVAKFSSMVNPGHPIPEAATKIHGITDADVADKPRLVDLAEQLLRICFGAVACAYNSEFDRKMIHAELGNVSTVHAFNYDHTWIDVLPIVKSIDKFERGKKLIDACARRGIVLEGAHRALADALSCGALLWSFKPRLKDMSAADLIALCDKRRAEQEEEFKAYKARQEALNGASNV